VYSQNEEVMTTGRMRRLPEIEEDTIYAGERQSI